jgi:thioredoxin 1
MNMKKIIKFEKNDCNPCAMVSDLLDKSGVEYEKINPFNNPELAVRYKIRSVPTVILFEQDQEVKRTVGFKPEELQEIMDSL